MRRLRKFRQPKKRGRKPDPMNAPADDQAGAPVDDLPGMADPVIRRGDPGFTISTGWVEPAPEVSIDSLFDGDDS